MRFVFACDSHLVDPVNPVLSRVLVWARRTALEEGAERLVLGGDMTHQDSPAQAERVLETLHSDRFTVLFLPGHNEGACLAGVRLPGGSRTVSRVTRLDWPGHAYALPAVDGPSLREGLAGLATLLPEAGEVLIFAHMPPGLEPDWPAAFSRPGLRLHWICGHTHESASSVRGPLRIEEIACLDPVKARGCAPGLALGEWDGAGLILRRLSVPAEVLRSPAGATAHPLGLACQGGAEALLRLAVEKGVPALQFKAAAAGESPAKAAAARFRETFPKGVLSLHLPSFPAAEEPPRFALLEPVLAWAEALGVDDLTIHLPAAPACRLFGPDKAIMGTTWAAGCLEAYERLAERALAMGAGLGIENMYNHTGVPPEEELLSSRPWHLLAFAAELRRRLAERGHPAEACGRIGLLLDVGHAFHDPVVSKAHGLGDWIARLAPLLRGAHLHQVRPVAGGGLKNHFPIAPAEGPRVNFTGLLPLFGELLPRPVPLFIEVRDPGEALASREVLEAVGRR